MIIDDDYCQYDTFRIINKADTDALARFRNESGDISDGLAELEKWKREAEKLSQTEEETEESVYQLTFANRMVQCWTKALADKN